MPTLVTPDPYTPAMFEEGLRAPVNYRGADFAVFAGMVRPGSKEGTVQILGVEIHVENRQLEPPPAYPTYFEVTGGEYHYIVSAWADRVEIEVCEVRTFRTVNVMFPSTTEELKNALDTIVRDACA